MFCYQFIRFVQVKEGKTLFTIATRPYKINYVS